MQTVVSGSKYQQIARYYEERIKTGGLRDGQQLPTEGELCNLFGVSRVTVRKALDYLAYQGFIVKKHSKGSFVRAGTASMCLDSLQGLTEEMSRRGLSVSSKLVQISLVTAGSAIASRLDIDEHSKVYSLERLRLVDGEPMAIEKVILPYFYCPDLEQSDLTQSLYGLLEQKYGLRLILANEALEATQAGRREAELLTLRPKAPVLKIERTSYLENRQPLEYAVSYYRGDKYKFHVTMSK